MDMRRSPTSTFPDEGPVPASATRSAPRSSEPGQMASRPTMVAAFRKQFPGVPIERNTVEGSAFFNRSFDGVLAWGLLFLLDAAAQALVIGKVARALEPQGRFVFTAPRQPLEWLDAMTGRRSQSLGEHTYQRLLRDAGLTWVGSAEDEGGNHYYFVERASTVQASGRRGPHTEEGSHQRRRTRADCCH